MSAHVMVCDDQKVVHVYDMVYDRVLCGKSSENWSIPYPQPEKIECDKCEKVARKKGL